MPRVSYTLPHSQHYWYNLYGYKDYDEDVLLWQMMEKISSFF